MLASIKFLDSKEIYLTLSFNALRKQRFCDLIHSEDTFIVRNVGRWNRFEKEAKGAQTNMSLEVTLTRTGSDVTADFFFLESVK